MIDDQHRALFAHANTLLTAILSGYPTDEVAGLVDGLIGSVVRHFNDEEATIAAAGFPGFADHAGDSPRIARSGGRSGRTFSPDRSASANCSSSLPMTWSPGTCSAPIATSFPIWKFPALRASSL